MRFGEIARIAATQTATVRMPIQFILGIGFGSVLNQNKYPKCDHKMWCIYIPVSFQWIAPITPSLFIRISSFQIDLFNKYSHSPINDSNMNIVFFFL